MTTQCHPGLQPHLSRTRPLLRLSTLMLALTAAVAPALSQEATTPTADIVPPAGVIIKGTVGTNNHCRSEVYAMRKNTV